MLAHNTFFKTQMTEMVKRPEFCFFQEWNQQHQTPDSNESKAGWAAGLALAPSVQRIGCSRFV